MSAMTTYINNVNAYLSQMKIKQTYLSMVTGMDKNKMSRLLTGSQEESGTDMEKIAYGLGKNIDRQKTHTLWQGMGLFLFIYK